MNVAEVECIEDPGRMSALLHPLRLEILERAQTPVSAAAIAADLGLARQKVNYHVRSLARCKLLRRAGTRKKRNMVEQRYVASARSYVLSPSVLGGLEPDDRRITDALSASRLLSLGSRMSSELGRVVTEAGAQDKRVATFSMAADVRFESPAQRAQFFGELQSAVTDVIARFSSPYQNHDGTEGTGRPFRFVVGCYPVPASAGSGTKGNDE